MYHSATVLLVDDEPLVLETYRTFLEDDGYSVILANSAENALLHIEKSSFDLFLCDVLLGGAIDGFELAEIVQERKPLVQTILFTGHPEANGMARASALHCVYLAKPVGFDTLKRTIESLLAETAHGPILQANRRA